MLDSYHGQVKSLLRQYHCKSSSTSRNGLYRQFLLSSPPWLGWIDSASPSKPTQCTVEKFSVEENKTRTHVQLREGTNGADSDKQIEPRTASGQHSDTSSIHIYIYSFQFT